MRLTELPRLGLLIAPSPVHASTTLASAVGVGRFSLKRDDLLSALHGGTKVRKLDVLLAREPWASAKAWVVSGAIGSGQVAATVAAGQQFKRPIHAHLFRTPLGAHGRENLAFSASYAASVTGYRNRATFALTAPRVLLSTRNAQGAVIPPGATDRHGILGCLLGGMELADQIHADPPDAVYLALGTGGTAVGVAAGLALAGMSVPVRAVAVVEHALSSAGRLARLEGQLRADLADMGVDLPPLRLQVLRGYLGRGYAQATPASVRGAALLQSISIAGEPVYTGKAMAAIVADIAAKRTRDPLLWVSVRRAGLPYVTDWRERLPPVLRPEPPDGDVAAPSRRGFLVGAAAAAALVGVARCTGYEGEGGEVLSASEFAVVRAAGEALFPDLPPPTLDALPGRVDRYLLTFPQRQRAEVHALFFAVEHTLPLSVGIHRFSAASPEDRLACLLRAADLGGPGLLIARSLRDLVLIAVYQDPAIWAEIGYEGPMVGEARAEGPYDALRAPPGWVPFPVEGG